MTTLVLEFKKAENDDKTICSIIYLNSKAERTINKSDIGDGFKSIYSTIISNIQKSLGKGSGWITDSVTDHNINIVKVQFHSW